MALDADQRTNNLRHSLTTMVSHDPRRADEDDPGRLYGMPHAGFDVERWSRRSR